MLTRLKLKKTYIKMKMKRRMKLKLRMKMETEMEADTKIVEMMEMTQEMYKKTTVSFDLKNMTKNPEEMGEAADKEAGNDGDAL